MQKTIVGKIVNDRCYVCGQQQATTLVRIQNDETGMEVPSCVECARMNAATIWDTIVATKGVFCEVRV